MKSPKESPMPLLTPEALVELRNLHGDRRRFALKRMLPLLLAEAERAVRARLAVLVVQDEARREPDPVPRIASATIAPIAEALGMYRREQPLVVSPDDAPRIIRP